MPLYASIDWPAMIGLHCVVRDQAESFGLLASNGLSISMTSKGGQAE